MKTLATAVIIAFAALPALANPTWLAVLASCETVDRGGYLNFVDPTCVADIIAGTGEDPREEKPVSQ